MSLLERIEADLVSARKGRDELALSTLGLLKSEIVKASKEPGVAGASDELAVRTVRKEIKRREEAAEGFRSGGRDEQAARELREAELLRTFLPPAIADEDLEKEVAGAIAEVRPSGPRDFGAVMKAATARVGDRAEGGRVAATARRLLGAR